MFEALGGLVVVAWWGVGGFSAAGGCMARALPTVQCPVAH